MEMSGQRDVLRHVLADHISDLHVSRTLISGHISPPKRIFGSYPPARSPSAHPWPPRQLLNAARARARGSSTSFAPHARAHAGRIHDTSRSMAVNPTPPALAVSGSKPIAPGPQCLFGRAIISFFQSKHLAAVGRKKYVKNRSLRILHRPIQPEPSWPIYIAVMIAARLGPALLVRWCAAACAGALRLRWCASCLPACCLYDMRGLDLQPARSRRADPLPQDPMQKRLACAAGLWQEKIKRVRPRALRCLDVPS